MHRGGAAPNAAQDGSAAPPIDVSTTGSASGVVPQPVTTAPEHTGASAVVGQSLLGAAEGTGELAVDVARSLALNALTLGVYSGYAFASAIWEGYDNDGIVGALNAVNPLYHIGRGAADTVLAIDRADYRAAGAAGTKAMVLAAVTVFGAGRGLGAAAEESVVVARAAGGAPRVAAYEVGTYDALKARSVVGDALDIHHVGQAHAMEQIVPGYSRASGSAIALPRGEHALVSTLRGPVSHSPRALLAHDIWNLRQFTNVPNGVLQ